MYDPTTANHSLVLGSPLMAKGGSLHMLTFWSSAHPQVDLLGDQIAHASRTQREVSLQLLHWRSHHMWLAITVLTCLHSDQLHVR